MQYFRQYISVDPQVRFGKPCIVGTRITVGDILGWLASGMTVADITDDFPQITPQHIQAALSWAAWREKTIQIVLHAQTIA